MAINIAGLVAVIVSYVAILITGVYFGRKTAKSKSNEAVLVADRSLGGFVSVFTMTATMVGGGYINGSAESAAWSGLIHTIAPFGYCLSFVLSALIYAPKMRNACYITMFDPFQLKYGKKMGGLLFIPQMLGDLFWSGSVLAALGATLSIIVDINATVAIVISAAVAIIYTFLGGLYSVAYTDVIQLLFIAVGLVIAAPFIVVNPVVDKIKMAETWFGEVEPHTIGAYIDVVLLTVFGGIPWQALYQRVLACKNARVAVVSTLLSSIFSLCLGVPPMIIGIAGSAADWNATAYEGPVPIPDDMKSFILPMALNYLSPLPIAILGIGAISAAVMSSADSCILSTSSVITKNIYQDIIRPQASERELAWVLRISILVCGFLGMMVAIFAKTIYGLFILCADLMYVVLFPQLTLTLWMPQTNTYGSLTGFVFSFVFRLLCGEPVIGLNAVLRFPGYEEEGNAQMFPFRTVVMLLGTFLIVSVSLLTNFLFLNGYIPPRYDVLKCLRQRTMARRSLVPQSAEAADRHEPAALPLTETKTLEPLL